MATRQISSSLPPLTALRAFECAARHLSFTQAARELSVTQAAVSHQVKQLESHLGVPLFRRLARRVELTRDGEVWARELGEVFSRLEEVNTRLRRRSGSARPVVRVSAIPSFAARWLLPRLGRFAKAHPAIDVRIAAEVHLVDFASGREPVDVGIRYGTGPWAGLVAKKLARDALVVVASPSYLAMNKLKTPKDLLRHSLLFDDQPEPWFAWLRAHGVPHVASVKGTVLTDSAMLVAAAALGQGVALARRSLAQDDLASGTLVLPFPKEPPMPTGRAYFLVGARATFARPEVSAFADWLVAAARELR